MPTPKLGEQLRYRFDNVMSRGTSALIGLLALVSAVLVLTFGTVSLLVADDDVRRGGVGHTLWMSLMRALDPGTVAGDTGNGWFIFLMLLVTVGGLFIVAALVGVLSSGLDERLGELRKGRSRVVERGHTVLLGWSDQVFTTIGELVAANESEPRSCVAILADKDKVEMEDELRSRLGSTGRTRLVCRTGNPTDPVDLEIASLDTAKAIVVMSPETDNADALVIKTLLALSNRSWNGAGGAGSSGAGSSGGGAGGAGREGHRPPVVTSVVDARNLAAARLAGGPAAVVIDADDIAARLVVETSRQGGLSVVFSDLLDFDGDEIYMRLEPALAGRPFGDALQAYETATAIGLCRIDGSVVLNPPMQTRIEPSDRMILLAEDDSTIRLAGGPVPTATGAIVALRPPPSRPERVLLLGWNSRAARVVEQLDQYVAAGSQLQIAGHGHHDAGFMATLQELQPRLAHLRLGYKEADITDRVTLESLDVGTFDHIVVLAEPADTGEMADTRTLVTLLHLRDMEATLGQSYSIVSEMNDERNRELAQVTKADDFVVGGRLISLLVTQLAENRHLAAVFASLFDPRGSEIYLRPAGCYVRPGEWLNFATVLESARRQGQTALGYRIVAQAHEPPHYGVRLNPPKHQPLMLGEDDRVIVLAEE